MSFHRYLYIRKVTLIIFVISIMSGLFIYDKFVVERRINKGISSFKYWMQNLSELVKSDDNPIYRATTTIPTLTDPSLVEKEMPIKSKEEKSNDMAVFRTITNFPSLSGSDSGTEAKQDKQITNKQSIFSGSPSENILKGIHSTKDKTLFQPIEEEEFPLKDSKEPRIPHIMHQIYVDEMIPEKYVDLTKSFLILNPTWEYRFWTDRSGRALLQKHHPYLVNVFDKFGIDVKRSDLLRYAVLYEYGGVYADFDMENFRPLNITTLKYACIFPVEPFEHSAFLYNKPYIINNAFMGCRPKHPFLKLLLSELRGANVNNQAVETTGPVYVTNMFIRYNNISSESLDRTKTDWSSNSPYFYKGQLPEIDDNAVYVPNSQYFVDKVDPIHLNANGKITLMCKTIRTLSRLKQRACNELSSRAKVRAKRKYTYTIHHWYHLYCNIRANVEHLKKVNISSVVPNYVIYDGE